MKLKKAILFMLATIFFLSSSNVFVSAKELSEIGTPSKEERLYQIADQEVIEALETHEYVPVLIYIEKQIDLDEALEERSQYLEQNMSSYEKKMTQRYSVVNSLKELAATTQYTLTKTLDKEKEKGNVEEYTNFYIVNMIYAKCNKEALMELSKERYIKSITIDKKIEIDSEMGTITEGGEKDNEIEAKTENGEKLNEKETITEETEKYNEIQEAQGSIEWGVKKIGADSVWSNYNVKGQGVVVGIIDSGFDWTHEAIKTKWRGYNPANPSVPNVNGNWFDAIDGNQSPVEDSKLPHGTHVIGTIVGENPTNNNIMGVAPEAQYIVARALTADGARNSWLLAAAEWMLAPGGDPAMAPDIINNSWGGAPGLDEWYRSAVQAWRAAGILPIFAAGNERGRPAPEASISAPANYPESFAVGAIDENNIRGIFSRRGPGPYANEIKPDIVGPGVAVKSAIPGGYDVWDGTSMATPHIAGVAALMLSYDPSLTPDQIEEILIQTATPLVDSTYGSSPNYGYGYGLVNALDAVATISSGIGELRGTVLKSGQDQTIPHLIHEQVYKGIHGMSIPIEVEVYDDISIKEVKVIVNNSDSIALTRISGDHRQGIFTGIIPSHLAKEGTLQYKLTAKDYADNIVESKTYDVQVIFGVQAENYFTDFTEEPKDWTQVDKGWQWGVPEGVPQKDIEDKVMGVNLKGNYEKNLNEYLITPPIDLRTSSDGYITFEHFYATEFKHDKGIVAATNNYGETWTVLNEYTGTSNGWKKGRVSLEAFVGSQAPVFVAFIFSSDASVSDLGWYIDNVSIKASDNIPPDTPQRLRAENTTVGAMIKWDAIVDKDLDLKEYKVYKSTTSQAIELAQEIAAVENTTYLDLKGSEEGEYNYFVKAVDYSGNESESSNVVTINVPKLEVIYFNDFENNDGGFIVGGTENQWQWGEPTSGPKKSYSGKKLWATNLSGDYGNKIDSWIQLPTISLDMMALVSIGFNYWIQSENNRDKGYIEIKEENSDKWTTLRYYTGEKVQGEERWNVGLIDISDYAGKNVDIRFRFSSDSGKVCNGWYIDDVKIGGRGVTLNGMENVSENPENSIIEYPMDDMDKIWTEGAIESDKSLGTLWHDKVSEELLNKPEDSEQLLNKAEDSKENIEPQRAEDIVNRKLHGNMKAENKEDQPEYDGKTSYEKHVQYEEQAQYDEKTSQDDKLQKHDKELYMEQSQLEALPLGIPVDAVVSIVETGKSTRVNLVDGTYRLPHPSNNEGEQWTVRITNREYKTIEDKVHIGKDGVTIKNYRMQRMLTGTVYGKVIDEITKEPIEGAFVEVVGVPNTMVTVTDKNGEFRIEEVPDGNQKLKISHEKYQESIVPFLADDNEVELKVELKATSEELSTPIITSIESGAVVQEDTIEISGISNKECTIKTIVNNKELGVVNTSGKSFKVTVPLVEGTNKIKFIAMDGQNETTPAEIIVVGEPKSKIPEYYQARIISLTELIYKESILISAKIDNLRNTPMDGTVIFMMKNEKDEVVKILNVDIDSINPSGYSTAGVIVPKPMKGNYTLEISVWDNINEMNVLSKKIIKAICIE